jgi:parallel beta-helix repeat protein
MRNLNLRTGLWVAVLGLATGLMLSGPAPALAGPMEPPVPPGTPTMMPLDQIEPRRPITADMLPLTITDAGSSWYLAESITTTGDGISVAADFVTIDLMGYRLEGGTGIGIRDDAVASDREGTTIMNGSLSGWSSHGVALSGGSRVMNLIAEQNGGNGIQIHENGRLIDCISRYNHGHGFDAGFRAYVRGCQAHANSENGLMTTTSTFIVNMIASNNQRNGIRTYSGCTVLNSMLTSNDQNVVVGGAGIWVWGAKNRIEGNNFDANNIGIHVDGNNNMIIRNTLPHSNGNVYDIDPGATGNYFPNFTIGTAGAPGPWDNLCSDDSCP